MVSLVALFETAENRHGVFNARFAHEDLLETALQGSVLLNKLAIFVEGRRANEAQLASGEHGLEHVGRSH